MLLKPRYHLLSLLHLAALLLLVLCPAAAPARCAKLPANEAPPSPPSPHLAACLKSPPDAANPPSPIAPPIVHGFTNESDAPPVARAKPPPTNIRYYVL
jgi:hypothetical protein